MTLIELAIPKIGDSPQVTTSLYEATWSLERARSSLRWQDQQKKQSIELWL